MKIYRSTLFIPGNKPRWMEQIDTYNVDAVILDMEDSVPIEEKEVARSNISSILSKFSRLTGTDIFVRINKKLNNYDEEDLHAIIRPGLDGIVLPKVELPHEIDKLSSTFAELEKQNNLPIESLKVLPILETAKSLHFAYEIALCDRVVGITGLSSKNGDVERALNTRWTPEGMESLYVKSKVVLAARAAEVTPIGGLWQDVHDHKGLEKSAKFNRQLDFDGELILHPSNAEVINEIYSPSEEEIAYYRGL